MIGFLNQLSAEIGVPLWALMLILIWTGVWKALALWKSARKNHPVWFVIFILVHTLGILEILYIFLFSKIKLDEKKKRKKR